MPPGSLRWSQSGPGVLMVHGFTSSPESLRPIGDRLSAAGFSVLAPLLAGHGGTPEDLAGSTAFDWRRSAELALLSLVEQMGGRGVAVLGVSLGGMLAVDLAAHFPVRALIAVNPALRPRQRLAPLSRYVWRVVPYVRFGDGPDNRVSVRAAGELVSYVREACDLAPRVQAPGLVMQSPEDPLVRPEGAQELYRLLGSRTKEFFALPTTEHVPQSEAAVLAVTDRVILFLRQAFEGTA